MKTAAAESVAYPEAVDLYDVDFFAWTQRNADRLRRRIDEADLKNVAQEIEDMGKRDLRELHSRLEVLLAHLLKWKLQPRKRSNSWRTTILTQRREIMAILKDSPSLRPRLVAARMSNYEGAVERAGIETGVDVGDFPVSCPFSVEEILETRFLPE